MPSIIPTKRIQRRDGAIIVLSALLMVALLAMTALAIDMGYMFVVKTQLQVAADSGALAAGNSLHMEANEVKAIGADFATRHDAGGRKIKQDEVEVELGIWDAETNSFVPGATGNAVKVTAKRDGESLFFAKVMGHKFFATEASAISMANPKDVVFVIDLSGSMNDDTEPAWATKTVNAQFGPAGCPNIGNQLMQDLYTDFGFGQYPGKLEYVGESAGVKRDSNAYANLTSDIGPLSDPLIGPKYQIKPGMTEKQRRKQAYNWIIDNQLKRMLPDVKPEPSTSDYNYWQKYIDYVIHARKIKAPKPPPPPKPPKPPGSGGGSGGGNTGNNSSGGGSTGGSGSGSNNNGSGGGGSSTPPAPKPKPQPKPPKPTIGMWDNSTIGVLAMFGSRAQAPLFSLTGTVYGAGATGRAGLPRVGGLNGKYAAWLPPSQDGDRIDRFNNPNKSAFPKAKSNLPRQFRNKFGYLTYVQFLMDHGRNLKPEGKRLTDIAMNSGRTPMHKEKVAGRTFSFPPRTQPMHAARRSVISAINVVAERNGIIPSSLHRDRIGVVSFDTVKQSKIHRELTADYVSAMESVTELQAVGDKNATTATEAGLMLADKLLTPESEGGLARDYSTRIAVVLTDGMPNAFSSTPGAIDTFASENPDGEFYRGGYHWYDAPLRQTMMMHAKRIDVYPVGIGLGTNYDFMDRMARAGGTADASGKSPRGSGNPAEYEQRLVEIFEEIIKKPVAKLVE